jgi:tetratricopeptide (TPR) repeat protein
MSTQENPINQEQTITEESKPTIKNKKQKKDKFSWWQSLLLLFLTLGISVSAAYYISDKYFWSDIDLNRLNEQLAYYKDKVDLSPNEPKYRVELGYTYFLKGDNDSAIKQLKTALDLDPKYYDAFLNLGIVYNDMEQYNDALKMAEKTTEIAPRDYKGHLLKGTVFRKLKLYDNALDTLSLANTLMPGNTDIIYEIGRLSEDQGNQKEAEELYKEALNYDPLYKPALEGLERVATKDTNK